ncbi:MAG: MBL fold metallo-hydrolase [Acidimicrobiaceae bacterium]|nr:MBL fold metallo-hydrolase [Acidimicrobiaceae bacterium]
MSAVVDVLTNGYVHERVASSVILVRENDAIIIIDPGMVVSREEILGPLHALGLHEDDVTDVIFSHHHPDHTLNAALFLNARYHDVWAIYFNDHWDDRTDVIEGAPSVSLLDTPGHTKEDISTLIMTDEGLVVCTHLWWSVQGPEVDPRAFDQGLLESSRAAVLALKPLTIIPGHGPAFSPAELTR